MFSSSVICMVVIPCIFVAVPMQLTIDTLVFVNGSCCPNVLLNLSKYRLDMEVFAHPVSISAFIFRCGDRCVSLVGIVNSGFIITGKYNNFGVKLIGDVVSGFLFS